MMPLFKPMILAKDNKVNHFSLYVMNRYRSSVDILDSLPYPKNHRPSKNTYHKDCEKIVSDIYYLYWINFSALLFLLFWDLKMCGFFSFLADLWIGPSNEGCVWWCSSRPIGSCLQRNQRLSRFHFKRKMNVAIILSSMRDAIMVKRSLITFEIMTWVSYWTFDFLLLAYCASFFMCHDFW